MITLLCNNFLLNFQNNTYRVHRSWADLTLYLLLSWQVFADNFVRREVASTVVSCIFSSEGCPWKGEVRHLEVMIIVICFCKEFLRGDMYSQFLLLSCAICEFCCFPIIMKLKLECRFHKNWVRHWATSFS